MKELSLEEAALAWAQGKRVEAIHKTLPDRAWSNISKAGESSAGEYSSEIFANFGNDYRYRLAPEPPEKKFRPWTPEEVPVGAQVRYAKNQRSIRMLITSNMEPHLLGYGFKWNLEDLCKSMEHSLDNGKTWLPCGVEVDA